LTDVCRGGHYRAGRADRAGGDDKEASMRIGFIGLGNMGGPIAQNIFEYHVSMMIAALAEQQMEEALRRGWGDRDSNAIFCLQQERAGVELRALPGGR
jgi:prephenate dehydrogenase